MSHDGPAPFRVQSGKTRTWQLGRKQDARAASWCRAVAGDGRAQLASAQTASAQTWPERPVRFITSQAAGNATDIIARITADQLVERGIGQPVVVENRPGGGNVIGTQAAARAAPDGYTFFLATAAALVTDPYTFKSLPYDPMKDFVPVAKVAEVSFMIMANPKVPAKNLQELIALAKSQPGKLTIATDGARRFSGMVVAWLNKLAGIEILQVPYTAQRQGVQDAVAGTVDLIILAVPVARGLAANGQLRPIATRRSSGLPTIPDVPAIAETFAGFRFHRLDAAGGADRHAGRRADARQHARPTRSSRIRRP